MPMYPYRYTDEPGGTFDEFQRMTDPHLTEKDGRPCERTVAPFKAVTAYGEGNHCDPIKMMSIAVDNEDEIAAFRERNPGTEISSDRRSRDFGVPVVKSRSEKLRVLAREGFVETN